MSEPNIQRILDNAATKYGSIPVSIAVELYGEAVIFDCNNQVPVWAEMDKINQIESQVNTFLNKTEISNAVKPLSIATEADEAKQ